MNESKKSKKSWLKVFAVSAAVLVVGYLMLGASGQVPTTQRLDLSSSVATNSYANSQVDTVVWNREPSVSGAAFAAHFLDSVSVTNVILRRVVDGTLQPVLAGDTLISSTFTSTTDGNAATQSFSNGVSKTVAITLAPLADTYVFIVTYAGSANGVTTATVNYEIIKQFARR